MTEIKVNTKKEKSEKKDSDNKKIIVKESSNKGYTKEDIEKVSLQEHGTGGQYVSVGAGKFIPISHIH